jgi:hypothetical protein
MRFVRINELLTQKNERPVEKNIGCSIYEVIPEVGTKHGPIYRSVIEPGESFINIESQDSTPAKAKKEINILNVDSDCSCTPYIPLNS